MTAPSTLTDTDEKTEDASASDLTAFDFRQELSAREQRLYERMLRHDPCAYCDADGGTIDHIIPRPFGGSRHSYENMTGACEHCNRRKDRGKDGGHRPLLFFMLGRRQRRRNDLRERVLASLEIGGRVITPWGVPGVITRIDESGIYLWVEREAREWRCANALALRGMSGSRLCDVLRLHERSPSPPLSLKQPQKLPPTF
jgi:hypothetical protein